MEQNKTEEKTNRLLSVLTTKTEVNSNNYSKRKREQPTLTPQEYNSN